MTSLPSSPLPSRLFRVLRLGLPLIGALLIVTFFFPGARHHAELTKYASVPPFSLTERTGKTVTNGDLQGKVWVADFIYTTCPGPCPIISASMAQLQQKLTGDNRVQLVSFSVDPQDDTPAVLTAYANRFEADPQNMVVSDGTETADIRPDTKGLSAIPPRQPRPTSGRRTISGRP